ncbi:MAG: adenylosuccinate lyase [Candidatus Micrarchaeota archaeon]|nr:adenylosuccinate lyase [Candidatus Micrarchaeota archaeon]
MVVSPLEERYATEMNAIFDEESKLKSWLTVEVALAKAHAEMGEIPKEAAKRIESASSHVKLSRVKSIESQIHHDLMAMVKALTEASGKEAGKYVHYGATSYDIEDTASALVLRDAFALLKKRIANLNEALRALIKKHRKTVCVARTHGQHAVPMTYGLKFALWTSEMSRMLERIDESGKRLYIGKMSGAAGTMATFGDNAYELQELVMGRLGLNAAKVTNQIVQRDREAEALFLAALIACTLEKMAKEIRNLQRTEIMELAEPFGSKQVGSSTMPQKRNPHKCERVCSLARVVRRDLEVGLENIALEHERDLTNSANERIILPEAFILTDYMLKQMTSILEGLEFFPENITRNLELTNGLILAERVMIELTKKGMGRQEAHEKIREASIRAFRGRKHLKHVLLEDKKIRKYLNAHELSEIFNPDTYIGQSIKISDSV